MKNQSVYEIITERIITLLEKGVIPWQKSWKSGNLPVQNLISKKPYRGVNVFLLNSLHYSSPYFLTFRQAEALGGFVKRREKACPVIFWTWLDGTNKETGKAEKIPLLRYYSVFNVSQCEGIEAHIPKVTEVQRENSPIQAAEQIVINMQKKPEIWHGFNQAFYSPAGDFVGMPLREQFKSAEDYYSVLYHELTHSTGHKSRLNRKGITGSEGSWSAFGSNSYSKEELIAEMGATFLCAEIGIVDRTIDNSAAYISGWLQKLRNDSKLIVQAAAQAQKASDFILGRWQGDEPEPAEPFSQN